MAEEYEPVKLIVDNLVLTGLEADLVNDNAVSKAYVDVHITSAINSLVNGALPALDTLKEIGDALGNDANIGSALTTSIASVVASVTSEAVARSGADATLRADLSTETAARISLMNGVNDISANESNQRFLINQRIDSETSARSSGDTALETKINDEISNREFEISRIQNAYSSAQSVLFGVTEEIKTSVLSETSVRTSEISRIEANLNEGDSLINSRINDASMQLETEMMARSNADVELSDRCDVLTLGVFNANAERNSQDVLLNARVTATNEDLSAESQQRAQDIEGVNNSKLNKSGGNVTGDLTLVDSYLHFGLNWRVKASGDGSKIVFQHKKADNVWRTAIPFICAV